MEDIDYGAVFGIDAGGAEETEPAEPSADTTAQGANGQETAEPADVEKQTEEAAAGTAEDGGQSAGGDGRESQTQKRQTPEQNAQFAAARRKAEAERDAAIAKAKEDARAEAQRTIDEAFRNSGLTNPYTKKPITTKAEYDEYRARFEEEKKARILKKSGMTDEEFRQFVEGLPEVRQAREAKEAAETAERKAREQQAKLKVEEQLKEISALDPTIKGLEDLARMETYPKLYELVQRGYTIADAFKLANYEALTGRAAAASRQAAINAAQGKQHLSQTTQRGTGGVNVPEDVKEEYRAFNPGITDEEIQKHYNRYMKKR